MTIAPPEQASSAVARWWAEHPEVARLTPPERSPLVLTVILVPGPPAGVEPLRWVLLTNLPVTSPTGAGECVGYDLLRWLTHAARRSPEAPCTQLVDSLSWQALWAVQQPTPSPCRQIRRPCARSRTWAASWDAPPTASPA